MNGWESLLVPPGAGVYTVSSGNDLKNDLWQNYFQSKDISLVTKIWEKQLADLKKSKQSKLIFACPSDSGAGIIKGSNWGPIFLRQALWEAGHSEMKDFDLGDLKVNPHLLYDELLSPLAKSHLQQQMYPLITDAKILKDLPVSPLSQIDFLTKSLWQENPNLKFLFLAGDHSCSYPIVKNWCLSRTNKKFAVVHFDAHTDLLEERLGIPYCFGTWAYHILPHLPTPHNLLQIGIRASGKTQQYWEENLQVKQIWAQEVRENLLEETVNKIVNHLKSLNVEEIYISFDVDALDPQYLSCTGTAEAHGLFPHHVISIVKALSQQFLISSLDVAEFAPFINQPNIARAQLEPDTSLLTLRTILPHFWNSL